MATERKHGHMKHIWEFYENMNEVVYVSDMDTYEMVYLNKYGREPIHMEFVKMDSLFYLFLINHRIIYLFLI